MRRLILISFLTIAPALAQTLTLSAVTILVRDQEEALRYYTETLGLEKRSDATSGSMRWLTVAPKGQAHPEIVLLKAEHNRAAQVGKGTTWVFDTTDCRRTYEMLRKRGVKFVVPPSVTPWGVQAIFEDLYGNAYALLEPSANRGK
jgi:predicted enzyme related to lactoylglutathione lyase